MARRMCARPGCNQEIPDTKRSDARYHSKTCQQSAAKARGRARKRYDASIDTATLPSAPTYDDPSSSAHRTREALKSELLSTGLWDAFKEGRVTQAEIARLVDRRESMVKRAIDELRADTIRDKIAQGWEMDDEMRSMLALDLVMPDRLNTKACRAWAVEAARRFLRFEEEFFIAPNGKPWIRKKFHAKWLIEIMFAFATGGYLQILSPPRHGKSELLTHFVVWVICRNPDIRILWVGPNEDLVKERVTKMEELLEMDHLRSRCLPPNKSFAPPKRGPGAVWTAMTFKVNCRTPGIAGNTVTGLGRGSKMLSRNADLIVTDDIEDHQSTETPSARKSTRRWVSTQLDSRKEEHTAWVNIGSRQHPDDWYGYNIEDPNYRVIVDAAHSLTCHKDEYDVDIHTDCMLFPELRTYRWLLSKKVGADARTSDDTDEGIYDMVYQNQPSASGLTFYTTALIKPSYNAWRSLGLDGIPSRDRRLVGGFDPGATRYQAAFLWATTPVEGRTLEVEVEGMGVLAVQEWQLKRWMVDLDNRVGGGIDKALDLWEEWRVRYGVLHWVIEDNALQSAFLTDPRVKLWKATHGAILEGSETQGSNKYDSQFGLGAMARLWTRELVDLPYGDEESRIKVGEYVNQLTKYVEIPERERKRIKDIHMASWFPQKVIRRWEREEQLNATRVAATGDSTSGYTPSYPNLGSMTTGINQAPWR